MELLRRKLPPWSSEAATKLPTSSRYSGGGRMARALVDTGCSTTVLVSGIVGEYKGEGGRLVAVDGREIRCEGTRDVELVVRGVRLSVNAIVLGSIADGVDIVMGMNAISQLGGVMIACGKEPVIFGKVPCLTARSEVVRCAVTVGLEGKPEKISEANGEKVEPAGTAVGKGLKTGAEKQTGWRVKVDVMKLNVGPKRTGDGWGAEPCRIEDKDFVVEFDGKKWIV